VGRSSALTGYSWFIQRQEATQKVLSKIQEEKALLVKCDVSKMLESGVFSLLWTVSQKQ